MLSALEAFIQSRDQYKIDIGFIDSGYKPEAIYEACKRIDGQYYPLKGPDSASSRFSMPQKASPTCMPYFECYANEVLDKTGSKLWLFHPNTEHWKNWIQERFVLAPWTNDVRTVSSGAIFDPQFGDTRQHMQFAKSIVSERLTHIPLPGKGYKTVWEVIDRNNNHWLDCMGYAAAAAAVLGVRLVTTHTPAIATERQQPRQESVNPYARHGRAFVATQR
jgi:phage terminase large subunit GpA-like protein